MQAGETHSESLIREVREEAGITISVDSLILRNSHKYSDKIVNISFYHCEILSGEPSSIEVSDFAWIASNQFQDYEFPPADSEL